MNREMKPDLQRVMAIGIGVLLAAGLHACVAAEAVLHIERRGNDVVLYITGGTSNVQYQVWTPANNNPADASQWYYWRRAYSRDFLSNPVHGEMLVYGTNTSQQTKRFFQIRGILPD